MRIQALIFGMLAGCGMTAPQDGGVTDVAIDAGAADVGAGADGCSPRRLAVEMSPSNAHVPTFGLCLNDGVYDADGGFISGHVCDPILSDAGVHQEMCLIGADPRGNSNSYGQCTVPCGPLCPVGAECFNGHCLQLCGDDASIQCGPGRVCEAGHCRTISCD